MYDSPADFRFPSRKRPVHALPHDRTSHSTIIFLTACTQKRIRALACERAHQQLQTAWLNADRWLVGRYLIMPDHVHFFCAPGAIPPHPLDAWVRYWKSQVTKALGRGESLLWQTDFWDVQIRNRKSYEPKWDYVRNNPVRAGLVASSEEWSFQGERHLLCWRE